MKKHITLMSSAWFILAAIIAVTTVIYLAWDNGSLAYSKVINRSINGGDVIIADQGKIKLGKKLFFDPQLSDPPGVSCASCHKPALAFTDGRIVAIGVNGRHTTRNTPTVFATALNGFQFWDGRSASPEDQALKPIVGRNEMDNSWDNVLSYLNKNLEYQDLFDKVFNGDITTTNVAKAIAAYEQTLVPQNTPYQRFLNGDGSALSASAKRGKDIFFGKGLCNKCHNASLLTDSAFHNTGVAQNGIPDLGRYNVTGAMDDLCRFKTPTLLDVGLTAPYMHNGSIKTLEAVVDFYNAGGSTPPAGTKDEYIKSLHLSSREKADLVNFLKSLTETP
ncbi:MAG: cytochrome-c peroxidase [Carboxydocellales bacterium]